MPSGTGVPPVGAGDHGQDAHATGKGFVDYVHWGDDGKPLGILEAKRMLAESGIGTAEDLEKAKASSSGLGLFVRGLVGMDRQAAKNALGAFLAGGSLRANQIQFLDEIVNHLTEYGCMETVRLYESPYTDFNPRGVDGVFNSHQVDALISALDDVR